ncbi:hypothetical protein HIM_06147 [Hirsutella minnesotensis 3608]|uniref:Uncharacterized protein n=1 Tax=Hirsutella minnesotensis 3608 TaxID=1043627 RepID=A0A0F7ZJM6_9HYPO|nr:hypothetical protein HIM_06147 [Hirsutella minnesotensis 3608]
MTKKPATTPKDGINIPRCIGTLPVCSASDLNFHLGYYPLNDDFWIPIPSRAAVAQYLVEGSPSNDLRFPDSLYKPEHHVAGILMGIALRKHIIGELEIISCRSQWQEKSKLERTDWFVRCQRTIMRMKRDIRNLETKQLYHSFDLPGAEYSTGLRREMDQAWQWAAASTTRDPEETARRHSGSYLDSSEASETD